MEDDPSSSTDLDMKAHGSLWFYCAAIVSLGLFNLAWKFMIARNPHFGLKEGFEFLMFAPILTAMAGLVFYWILGAWLVRDIPRHLLPARFHFWRASGVFFGTLAGAFLSIWL